MEFPFGARTVKISIAIEIARSASAAASAATRSAAALRRIGFSLFATVSAALRRMLETAFRIALLILCGVRELLPTVQTLNHHVFVHLPRTSRGEIGGRVGAS